MYWFDEIGDFILLKCNILFIWNHMKKICTINCNKIEKKSWKSK